MVIEVRRQLLALSMMLTSSIAFGIAAWQVVEVCSSNRAIVSLIAVVVLGVLRVLAAAQQMVPDTDGLVALMVGLGIVERLLVLT